MVETQTRWWMAGTLTEWQQAWIERLRVLMSSRRCAHGKVDCVVVSADLDARIDVALPFCPWANS